MIPMPQVVPNHFKFPILYYYGGAIIEGPHGPEYSGGSKFKTNGCHHTTYEEVKLVRVMP